MILKLKFFDREDWSTIATIRTILVLVVLWAFGIPFGPSVLILSTVLAMMFDSSLTAKVIFTFFLCMMLKLGTDRGSSFFKFTIPFLVAALLLHVVKDAAVIEDLSRMVVRPFRSSDGSLRLDDVLPSHDLRSTS